MKRMMLALCLATVTAAAQAETRDHHHAKAANSPGRAESALRWFAAHAAAPGAAPAASRAPARIAKPHIVTVAVTPSDTSAAAPPAPVRAAKPHVVTAAATPSDTPAAAPPAPVRTAKPHVVTAAVTPSDTPAAAPPTRALFAEPVVRETPRQGHGRISSCNEGQRIISAYYMDGRRTASGERFDPNGMTAAHRTLPFGTHLKVINPRNGKVVMVRINDRGPFVKGVTLDLSRGAAQAIGLSGTGAVCMAQM